MVSPQDHLLELDDKRQALDAALAQQRGVLSGLARGLKKARRRSESRLRESQRATSLRSQVRIGSLPPVSHIAPTFVAVFRSSTRPGFSTYMSPDGTFCDHLGCLLWVLCLLVPGLTCRDASTLARLRRLISPRMRRSGWPKRWPTPTQSLWRSPRPPRVRSKELIGAARVSALGAQL